MKDVAKETFPVPSGSRILDTYGNVIKGKMNDDIVRIEFIRKFSFKDGGFEINLPLFCMIQFLLTLSTKLNVIKIGKTLYHR